MRVDNPLFATDNQSLSKELRFAVAIDFDGAVQFFTSHADIANVPGTPIQGVLQGVSATSQTLHPDRANATIGAASFDLVDVGAAFTDHVRTQLLTNAVGLRGRTVNMYIGYASDQTGSGIIDATSTDDNPDFDNFALFQTQVVQKVTTKGSRYTINCADIQRQTKTQIFELALTYLISSISETDTTIPCLDVSGFEGLQHGTSYSDAPSQEVLYIKMESTKEIIRCPVSGISGNSFTGVTRGVFGTTAAPVEVDTLKPADRRPKVEEYVYLEMPAVKLALAILTGNIHGTADVLPSGWHCGVSTGFVREADFTGIGTDLWNTTDDTAGVVLRFDGIEKQDAKRFLETQLYLLLGVFSPVYADGQLGLKRMVPSLSDSPYVALLDDNNTVSAGPLTHDMESMQNNLRVDWSWNGERYIRSTIVVDSGSIAKHGQAPERRLQFRGLVGSRYTEQVLRQLLTSLRDMYTGPPLKLPAQGFHMLNTLEVGDAVRVNLTGIRDYTQSGSNLHRTMAIHGMTVDWLKGVNLKLFGSSERADEIPPIAATTCMPDAFYSSEGVSLSTIPGLMTGNATNTGTFTLTGSADMNAAASIFYWDADLTISSDTILNIVGNVQLRVRGFLTINGDIDGVGNGHVVGTNLYDPGQHYYWEADANQGNPGFIGNSNAHRGLLFRYPDDGGIPDWVWVTRTALMTEGQYSAFPNLVLTVDEAGSGSITGIPTDMRGGGGSYGSPAGEKTGISGRSYQRATGGAGGAGGAALCVICRGGDFGVSGSITLDGEDSIEPASFWAETGGDYNIYGGAGGAGCPGALLWLLDGSAVSFPDLAGHFSATTGVVPATYALPLVDGRWANQSLSQNNRPRNVMAPYDALFDISAYDQTSINFRISYLPCDVVPEEDQDESVPAPTNLAASTFSGGVQLSWDNPGAATFDHIEIWRANSNARAGASRIATTQNDYYTDTTSDIARFRYYWIRAIDVNGVASIWEPVTSTTPAVAYPLIPQPTLIADPLIRQGSAYWEEGTGVTYVAGGGIDGTDAIRVPLTTAAREFYAAERRGPNEWDGLSSGRMAVEVRWRVKLQSQPGGTWSGALQPRIKITDEDGLNSSLYTASGDRFWTEADSAGVWYDQSAVIEVADTGTPPRYIQVGMLGGVNALGPVFDVDFLDATLVGTTFAGADRVGMVPDPGSEQGKVLQDDGSWLAPRSVINTQNGAYGLVATDDGKTIYSSGGGGGWSWIIPAESSVNYGLGTMIAFDNESGGSITIAITTDTLVGTDGATGSRTLSNGHRAVVHKVSSGRWRYAASDL